MESPIIKKGSGISPIWVLPLVALCISGWLLYTSYRDAGITCIIHFDNAEGITAGKTQVMYKGLAVGIVEKITIDDDLQGVNLTVKMAKKAKRGIVEDTKFWIVRPQISAGRISGLETLLSGSYIAVQPGNSTEFATRFEGLPDAPPLPADSPGLHITLMSDALYSLQKDSPVYTKNLKIGKVLNYYLNEDRSVLIDLYIEPEYSHLVQMGTRFWNSSGFSFEGNLQSGFDLKFQSLASFVYGGISCATPEPLVETSPQALNGLVYKLYPDFEAAEYWLPMSLQLASGQGIVEGKTKVMFRGLKAGVVQKIRINRDENITVTAEILLDPRAEPILKKGTRFWVVRPEISFDGISEVNSLLTGPYITFLPGEGVFQEEFVVETGPMPRQIVRSGKHFVLTSSDNGFLDAGSSIYFNGIKVGEVTGVAFADDSQTVRTEILVYEEYAHLVKESSTFWNQSGVTLDASLAHIKFDLGSIMSILKGGISFTNPEEKTGEQIDNAAEGSSFRLFSSLAEATKNISGLRPPGMVLHLQPETENYYDVGAPLFYRKIPAGEVLGHSVSADRQGIIFDVLIYEKFAGLINESTLFYNNSGFTIDADLSGIEFQADNISSVLSGGIAFMTPEQRAGVQSGHTFALYEDYNQALRRDDITITLHMNKADGVGENTKLRYQGIEIGAIRNIRFGPNLQEIIASAAVQKDAATLFRETSRLWMVRPSINLKGVQNLSTVLTGPYIHVMRGEGELRTDFDLQPDKPVISAFGGLSVVLETPGLGFLNLGNPIYYRQVQVGQVAGFDLSPTAQQVLVEIQVYPEYEKLVYRNTKFWLVSGFNASGGLFSGLQFDAESLDAILSGGIAFATPEGEEKGEPARSGDHFTLHDKKDATWTSWSPKLELSSGESQVDKPGAPH